MPNDRARETAAPETERARRARLDALLDAALQGTFPASDPIAVSFDTPDPAPRTRGKAS